MDKILLTKESMDTFIESFVKQVETYAPVQNKSEVAFDKVTSPDNIVFDYTVTQLSPKKYLHKPFETLFYFNDEEGVTEDKAKDAGDQVLFGVHPCDLKAIELLDRVFSEDYEDPYYSEKRNKSIIVGLTCSDVRDTCFCTSYDSGPDAKSGFDLLVTELGDQFLIEVGTEKGRNFLEKHVPKSASNESVDKYLEKKEAHIKELKDKITQELDPKETVSLLETNVNHPVWKDTLEDCFGCGTCTMVCPTCFCFNVIDKVDLSLKQGERERVWDSCKLLGFAEVALGENFRPERTSRVKQRIYHKLYGTNEQFGLHGCVGCGRCIEYCVAEIDMRNIVNEIGGDE